MNKAAAAIAAEQLPADKVKQLYINHWNTKGILRHQWLAIPSMIGPVSVTRKFYDPYRRKPNAV